MNRWNRQRHCLYQGRHKKHKLFISLTQSNHIPPNLLFHLGYSYFTFLHIHCHHFVPRIYFFLSKHM